MMKPILASITGIALLASAASGVANAAPGQAQAAPGAPSCSAAEFAQMDFWLGEWDVVWDGGQGVNRITKELDGCVIQESFEGGPSTGNLIGRSVSTFDQRLGRWRQTWVDNQGGYFALTGGQIGDDFVLVNSRLTDDAPHLRMLFEDIEANSLIWRWQRSTDNGQTWTDAWVISYRRRT
jgi:hypothetical protein